MRYPPRAFNDHENHAGQRTTSAPAIHAARAPCMRRIQTASQITPATNGTSIEPFNTAVEIESNENARAAISTSINENP